MRSLKKRLQVGDYVLAKSEEELDEIARDEAYEPFEPEVHQMIANVPLKIVSFDDDLFYAYPIAFDKTAVFPFTLREIR